MAGFPNTVEERVLWRLDADDPQRPHLLVLTERSRPDWSHLVEQAGWPAADGDHFLIRDYSPLLDTITAGQEYAFRLHANPVQNTHNPQKPTPQQELRLKEAEKEGVRPRGFRIGHRTAAAQMAWLLKRAEKAGFAIPAVSAKTPVAPGLEAPPETAPAPDAALVKRGTLRFSKKKDGPRVVLTTATFEGRLRVTDASALRASLLGGIGPGKAYGCGLLTLAPLPAGGEEVRRG